jgi:hypothetical protein
VAAGGGGGCALQKCGGVGVGAGAVGQQVLQFARAYIADIVGAIRFLYGVLGALEHGKRDAHFVGRIIAQVKQVIATKDGVVRD